MDKEHAALVKRLRESCNCDIYNPCAAQDECLDALQAADAIEDLSRQLDAARAEGFAEAREMADQVCATHGVLGGPTPNPYACWKVHADNIAAAIRALQPKEKPHD